MKYIFIEDNRSIFRLGKMCQVLSVSKSGYYAWLKRPECRTKLSNQQLLSRILDAFSRSRQRYGSRRIWFELRLAGIPCSKNRVARLMQRNGIKSRRNKKFKTTTNSKHNLPVAPNLVNRNFTVTEPNRVWVSDITYLWTWEGWIYLAVILDLYAREVVGWAMSTRLTSDIAISALNQAIVRRAPLPGLIFHSDRGIQFASAKFRERLARFKVIQSMSRKGDCYDNAVAESFFATLKTELVYPDFFRTRDEARSAVFEFIEIYYNRRRLHSYLNYLAPCMYQKTQSAA